MSTTGVEDLARYFTERRAELGLSREQVAERAEMSVDAIKAIEGMKPRRYHPKTRRKLEQAVKWEPGSFDEILQQVGPPKPLPSASASGPNGPLDPMTASNAELGAHADWMSETSGDPEVGARWLAGVLLKRSNVETSHKEGNQGQRRAM